MRCPRKPCLLARPSRIAPNCELQASGVVGPPKIVTILAATPAAPQQPRERTAAAAAMTLASSFTESTGKGQGGVRTNLLVVKKNADEDVQDADEFDEQQDYYLVPHRSVGLQSFQSTNPATVGGGDLTGTWFARMDEMVL